MSAVPESFITQEGYLENERLAEFKSEYFRGEVFAMSGVSYVHTLIKDNLAGEMRNHLKAGVCKVLTSDLRVKVDPGGLYTYPDVVIVCDKPQFEDGLFDTLLNPRVLVEVLSDSTEKNDRGTKFRNYREIPSLTEYVLIAQDRPLIERYVRQSDGSWLLSIFSGLSATFQFTSVPVAIPASEIYRGVEFPKNAGP